MKPQASEYNMKSVQMSIDCLDFHRENLSLYPKCCKQKKFLFFLSFFLVFLRFHSTSRTVGQGIPLLNTVNSNISPGLLLEVRRRDGYIQLEVSEWTLPGPSVGDVTDEGVGASCHPPFVCVERREEHRLVFFFGLV